MGCLLVLLVFTENVDGLVQERRHSSALAMEWRLSCINPDGLMQERCNSSALAMEWRLSCINPDGLMQERCHSGALAMELPLSCINPTMCPSVCVWPWCNNVGVLEPPQAIKHYEAAICSIIVS